ncbi:MAG: HD-GYP domain-containing protein [Actinomycetota bacterium]
MSRTAIFATVAVALPLGAVATIVTSTATWPAAHLLFWLVLVAASGCAVCALWLAWIAHRNQQAELGFVAIVYYAASVLPLVHGITVPGVLYGDNSATVSTVFLAVPLGLLGIVPTLAGRTAPGRRIGRHWRWWLLGSLTVITAVAVTLAVVPTIDVAPTPGSPVAVVAVAAQYGVMVVAGRRHVRLADIADRHGPLVIAYGFLLFGSSTFVFLAPDPWGPYFWAAHALDAGGVFLATIGGVVVYRRQHSLGAVLRPVIATDPHAAMELSLTPVVHRFVADLERKDEMTRDHVVRTGELTTAVAVELGLGVDQVRRCGLVGLLHDVGKLAIPDEILTKPGSLDDDEYELMKLHTVEGARLLEASTVLADVADAVRAHHERIDGRGYPDGLAGDDIPLEARVTAACDAYDAMTNTRHYRKGMDAAKVRSILTEHAGAQWDADIVDALLRVVGDGRHRTYGQHRLEQVGRGLDAAAANVGLHTEIGCDCVPQPLVAAGLTTDGG